MSEEESYDILSKVGPYVEKLIETPAGISLLAVIGGVFLKQTHVRASWVRDPSFVGPPTPEPPTSPEYQLGTGWKYIPPSYGFDLVVAEIELPDTVRNAENFVEWVKEHPNQFNPFQGTIAIATPRQAPHKSNMTVTLRLSDVLIAAGAAGLGVSALSNVIPKL